MIHLSSMGMMCPPRADLLTILKSNFSEEEAKVALAIPSKTIPFHGISLREISKSIEIPMKHLKNILESLTNRGLLFSYKDQTTGEMNYALQQSGFGFPQVFFWKGEDTIHSRRMANQVLKYFDTEVTKESYCTNPIPFRFIPVDEIVEPETQTILPYHVMEEIIKKAKVIAVAHCICRQSTKLIGRECEHPKEVCMKFNDLARYIIDKGFAREVSTEEALEISKKASDAGLVHFTDNAIDNVQQNCNCCGCSCWNLGRIRRRMIPRDEIIATYFIRETIYENCVGCGNCIDICPADAIKLEDNHAVIDTNWCVGCGVCVSKCPNEAIKIALRKDLKQKIPEENFQILHRKILKNRN
ncbi:MAG: 4Fe-4S binding protein, partial [Candidatus Heimdallarchaeota archaeon]